MNTKLSPNPNLVLPKPSIKTEDWLGKEPNPQKSEMEKRLELKNAKDKRVY